jgi:hypothetical protein
MSSDVNSIYIAMKYAGVTYSFETRPTENSEPRLLERTFVCQKNTET